MKKILAILRVSTEEQEIESQKVELGTFIKSKGYAEDEVLSNVCHVIYKVLSSI